MHAGPVLWAGLGSPRKGQETGPFIFLFYRSRQGGSRAPSKRSNQSRGPYYLTSLPDNARQFSYPARGPLERGELPPLGARPHFSGRQKPHTLRSRAGEFQRPTAIRLEPAAPRTLRHQHHAQALQGPLDVRFCVFSFLRVVEIPVCGFRLIPFRRYSFHSYSLTSGEPL